MHAPNRRRTEIKIAGAIAKASEESRDLRIDFTFTTWPGDAQARIPRGHAAGLRFARQNS
jgi:hypothetical protein